MSGDLWPFILTSLSKPDIAVQLATRLPPLEQAIELINSYFTSSVWHCSPIGRSQVHEEILPLFYPSLIQERAHLHPLDETILQHSYELAVLLILFACAISVSNEPENLSAAYYAKLGRLALGIQSVFEDISLVACQAIYLLGAYEGSARKGPVESSWRLKSVALALASSVRSCSRLNVDRSSNKS